MPVKKQTPKKSKSKSLPLTTDEAALVKTLVRPKETPCGCGCGTMTPARFRPGHDSQLLGRLRATLAADDDKAKRDAKAALVTLGWESK